MIDPKLATRYFQTHGLHVAMTFGLLLIAFIENYYINCSSLIRYNPFWCTFGWVYLVLGFILLSVAHYYRKLAKQPRQPKKQNHQNAPVSA